MHLRADRTASSLQWLVICICLQTLLQFTVVHGFPFRPGTLSKRQINAPGPNPDWLTGTYIGPVDKDTAGISTYDRKQLTLKTHYFIQNHYQAQAHIANGYIGISLPAVYGGFERDLNLTGTHQPVQGWPEDQPRQTFAGIAGFYDNQEDTTRTNFPEIAAAKNESVIAGIPIWSYLQLTTSDGHTLASGVDNKTISEYERTMDFATNHVTTVLKWTPDLAETDRWFKVNYTIYPHQVRFNLAVVSLSFETSKNETVTVTDILDGYGAVRSVPVKRGLDESNSIYTVVSPVGVPEVNATEYSTVDFGKDTDVVKNSRIDASSKDYVSRNKSSIAQEWTIKTRAGKTAEVHKFVGIVSSDAEAFRGKEFAVAKATANIAKDAGVDRLFQEHKRALDELWGDFYLISIPGQPNLETALRTSLASLLYATREEGEGPGINDNSIPVGGQSSDSYAGLIFWDADLWMHPGLLTISPSHASTITNYRLKLADQAAENAKERNKTGLAYPWTSGRYGDCTGTGPCFDYQYHLNTDIALSLWHTYCQTGNLTWLKEEAWDVIKGITDFMTDIVHKNETTNGEYWLTNMTDPDEYANHVENGAFTMAGIKTLTSHAMKIAELVKAVIPEKWKEVNKDIAIPYNWKAGIIPEYATMNGSVEIKQADVTLINYPLEFKFNNSQAKRDSDFYGIAQSPDGPAMTWGISAINMAELEESGCSSYTYLLVSCLDYVRQPFWQWSEQVNDDFFINGGTNPAFSFHTGAGGCLQTIMFGFGGKRFRDYALYIDPMLTSHLAKGGITYVDRYHNHDIEVSIQAENTTVHRRFSPGDLPLHDPITVEIGKNNKAWGNYTLYPGETLTVPTRRPDLEPPVTPGNVAQCKSVDTPQLYEPGKYPVGAVDGNNATYWQPLSTESSFLDIDLGKSQPISSISINWGAVPAARYKLYTTGSDVVTLGDNHNVTAWVHAFSDDNVRITSPWDPVDWVQNIRIREGNMSIADFGQTVQSRFVRLEVAGTLNYDEPATVAEVAVIAN